MSLREAVHQSVKETAEMLHSECPPNKYNVLGEIEKCYNLREHNEYARNITLEAVSHYLRID